MRPRTRDRVKRILIAALLNSGLSEAELHELADELNSPNGYAFLDDFGRLIRALLAQLRLQQLRDQDSKQSPQALKTMNLEQLAFNFAQRRRLSKKEVLQIIEEVTGSESFLGPDQNHPLRDILRHFFRSASNDQAQKFITRIQPRDDDEFLHGIIGRR